MPCKMYVYTMWHTSTGMYLYVHVYMHIFQASRFQKLHSILWGWGRPWAWGRSRGLVGGRAARTATTTAAAVGPGALRGACGGWARDWGGGGHIYHNILRVWTRIANITQYIFFSRILPVLTKTIIYRERSLDFQNKTKSACGSERLSGAKLLKGRGGGTKKVFEILPSVCTCIHTSIHL